MKMAICYWGLTRSLQDTYLSHRHKLFEILDNDHIEYDIFIHTWDLEGEKQRIWTKEIDDPQNLNDCKLLNPTKYQIDSQKKFLNSIDLPNYLKEHHAKKFYHNRRMHHVRPQMIINHVCALESQSRVYSMTLKGDYNYLMFIRPDVELRNKFQSSCFKHFKQENENEIMLINGDDWWGRSDKFAIVKPSCAALYANRLSDLIEYKQNYGAVRSEVFMKFVCEKYNFKILRCKLKFRVVRPGKLK